MKASLFLAFFCLAAVAVTAASAKNIDDVSEHENVEAVGTADGVQPLGTCSIGTWACVTSCVAQGRKSGYCNSAGTCICTN